MINASIFYNDLANSYEALLPAGYRFTSGPHMLVEPASTTGRPAPKRWRDAALDELRSRLAADAIEPCDCEDCQLHALDLRECE